MVVKLVQVALLLALFLSLNKAADNNGRAIMDVHDCGLKTKPIGLSSRSLTLLTVPLSITRLALIQFSFVATPERSVACFSGLGNLLVMALTTGQP